ncbi:hypothetical protein JZO86_15350 [Enterococcus ureasiticus]|uniref:hypothetical protein n=1 Tax=Enterococcus ureasiticus TaxID=903984 RepID=UPI001A8DB1C4|nr:hypothetical protein [Enterococcus ureasiticus]MBO0475077.1 hypothetical protein [Enterococcus ureasiticus]
MNEYTLKYHSEIPNGFATSWSVYCDKDLTFEYNLEESGILQIYSDDVFLFVRVDEDFFYIRSNKQFNQTLSAGSSDVEITFR